ncbi:hypothetical protein TNCV_1261771 [Trichonephila clavipes]|nr:hypothetical protein TNCV_1261771 [Trichonephila clavipes]
MVHHPFPRVLNTRTRSSDILTSSSWPPQSSTNMIIFFRFNVYQILMSRVYNGIPVEFGIPVQCKKGCAAFHSRRESITGKSLTSFPEEDTAVPYSGLEPEPTRLQAEGHIHHTACTARQPMSMRKEQLHSTCESNIE